MPLQEGKEDNTPPEKASSEERNGALATIFAIIVVLAVLAGVGWLLFMLGSLIYNVFAAINAGMSFQEAFMYSIMTSVGLIVLFALVADGFMNELETMIAGFFIFIVFFTFALAWAF